MFPILLLKKWKVQFYVHFLFMMKLHAIILARKWESDNNKRTLCTRLMMKMMTAANLHVMTQGAIPCSTV